MSSLINIVAVFDNRQDPNSLKEETRGLGELVSTYLHFLSTSRSTGVIQGRTITETIEVAIALAKKLIEAQEDCSKQCFRINYQKILPITDSTILPNNSGIAETT